jgi:hypothetical protein
MLCLVRLQVLTAEMRHVHSLKLTDVSDVLTASIIIPMMMMRWARHVVCMEGSDMLKILVEEAEDTSSHGRLDGRMLKCF